MRHVFLIAAMLSFTLGAFAGKNHTRKTASMDKKISQPKVTKQNVSKKLKKVVAEIRRSKWNNACSRLLENSVISTVELERSLSKKKNLSRLEFDSQIHNEILVVQLNAWVCAVTTTKRSNAVAIEQKFLQDYSTLVKSVKL